MLRVVGEPVLKLNTGILKCQVERKISDLETLILKKPLWKNILENSPAPLDESFHLGNQYWK